MDMNEQDELTEQQLRRKVYGVINSVFNGGYMTGQNDKDGLRSVPEDFDTPTDSIIALVEQDVARRLLSGGRDVIAKWLPPRTDKHDPMWDMIDIEDMARDIAAAIGLTVEDDTV